MQVRSDAHAKFMSWLTSPAGQALLNKELELLTSSLANKISPQALIVEHKHFAAALANAKCFTHLHTITADQLNKKLLYPDNSMDCIILPHILSYTDDKILLIKELQRLLTEQGKIIFIECNPYSWPRISAYFKKHILAEQRNISASYLRYMVNQLEFNKIVSKKINGEKQGLGWLLPSEAYLLIASRKSMAVTLLPKFKPARPLLSIPSVGLANTVKNYEAS